MTDVDQGVIRVSVMTAEDAERGWREREGTAERRCVAAWTEACGAWWSDPEDRRLCHYVCEMVLLDETELPEWQALAPDAEGLIRLHRHVVAMRAAHERGSVRRKLVVGALRTGPVISFLRTGQRVEFPAAADVPALVAELARTFATLPANPLHRAAWLAEVIGAIHPFIDSNGGTLRFAASLELARACFPPLALTWSKRSGAYVAALVAHDLAALEHVIYDNIQQQLARLLMRGDRGAPSWGGVEEQRSQRWIELTGRIARERVGAALVQGPLDGDAVARMARLGYDLVAARVPRGAWWKVGGALPVHLDLAVTIALGGPTRWLVAVIGGSIGNGALAPVLHDEEVAHAFIAPANEEDTTVDARFARWIDERIAQISRGLAAWS
jgi:hypothetical protein